MSTAPHVYRAVLRTAASFEEFKQALTELKSQISQGRWWSTEVDPELSMVVEDLRRTAEIAEQTMVILRRMSSRAL